MKFREVRKLSDEEIVVEAKRIRQRLFELRNQAVTEKIQDTSQYAKLRRDLARLLTEQSSRALSAATK
jgi:large subunit ribosomal protein L29